MIGPKIGPMEMVLLLGLLLILFGPNKLPQLARSIGRSVNEFKDGIKGKPDSEKEAE